MEKLKERFETVWEAFITAFGGALIVNNKNGDITFQDARLALNTCIEMWHEDASICGNWLNKLCKTDEAKGEKVKDTIEDIELQPIDNKKIPGSISGAGALGAAVIGYAASKAFNLGTIATVASTIGPAVVAYPVVSSMINKSNAKKSEAAINGYLAQVEQHKNVILAILE